MYFYRPNNFGTKIIGLYIICTVQSFLSQNYSSRDDFGNPSCVDIPMKIMFSNTPSVHLIVYTERKFGNWILSGQP